MTVKVSELRFSKAPFPSTAPEYGEKDLGDLKKDGAVRLTQVAAIYDGTAAFMVVGVDANNNLMIGSDNKAALPCPIWCHPGDPPQQYISLDNYND